MKFSIFIPLLLCVAVAAVPTARAVDPAVLKAETARVTVLDRISPAVVAMCVYGGQAMGSGVLIDPEGYALTNFHVTSATGPILSCGLADGVLYDAVLVGHDKVGDVALVKMLPRKPGMPFPFVKMGDSDKVKIGDWSLALGNPFSLASDFTPTVTYGLVSGVNRYQPPEGKGTLEYTDCIQIDTSINPGNSGGPLFNMNGELIGINGRGSFEKRMRINSGVGYAISINQIKNFLGHLYAGLDCDHATLGAEVRTADEDGDISKMVVKQILETSDAYRRGLMPDDELAAFAGRPLTSTNQYKNVLGIFPKEWRVPLAYRRNNDRKEVLVRLEGTMVAEKAEAEKPMPGRPPRKADRPSGPDPKKSPAAKLFKEKEGFANLYFNELERDKLLAAVKAELGDFSKLSGVWSADGSFDAGDRKGDLKYSITDGTGKDASPTVKLKLNVEYVLEPLKENQAIRDLLEPLGSGGLMVALYHHRRLLVQGPAGFEGGCHSGGTEPYYPYPADGTVPVSLSALRVDCDVLRTRHAGVECKWFFNKKDHTLLGCEAYVNRDEDPCELTFSDYKPVEGGGKLPHRIEVRHGDKRYGVLMVKGYSLK